MARITFGKGSEAYHIYQRLRAAGVPDSTLDTGVVDIDYTRPGPNETVRGAGDGVLEEREVIGYALDHFERFPEIAGEITGRPIPWSLDDHDPTTTFDAEIRAKTQAAITTLDRLLRTQGVAPGTLLYRERLAVGLFYFAVFPDTTATIAADRPGLLQRTAELQSLGLTAFQDALFRQGGLGTLLTYADAAEEATALETLRTKRGFCTERSKVVFAVFRMAGLDPQFASLRWQDLQSTRDAKPFSRDGHMVVALRLGHRYRLFEPSLTNVSSDARYPNFYPKRLIHYLADDIGNRHRQPLRGDNASDAALEVVRRQLHRAIRFDPGSLLPRLNLILLLARMQQFEPPTSLPAALLPHDRWLEAAVIGRETARLYPNDGVVRADWGYTLIHHEELAAAVAVFHDAIRLEPRYGFAHIGLGLALASGGAIDDGVRSIRDGIGLEGPQQTWAHMLLARFHLIRGDLLAAEIACQSLSADTTWAPLAQLYLGIIAFRRGERRAADGHFRAATRQSTTTAWAHQFWLASLENAPQYAVELWTNIGLTFLADNKRADARSALGSALQLAPQRTDIRQWIEELR